MFPFGAQGRTPQLVVALSAETGGKENLPGGGQGGPGLILLRLRAEKSGGLRRDPPTGTLSGSDSSLSRVILRCM